MSALASVFGSGAGAVAIALAVLAGRHYRHLPGSFHPWVERGLILLMYAGGSAIAVTDAGRWIESWITDAAGWLGGFGSGVARAALIIACISVLLAVLVALFVAPSVHAGYLAAAMPVVLALAAGGFLHQLYLATALPGQALASGLTAWLGG